jgi:hypothetical protein
MSTAGVVKEGGAATREQEKNEYRRSSQGRRSCSTRAGEE